MTKDNQNSGCLSIFFPFLNRKTEEPKEITLPYLLRDDFLSPAEFSFYKIITAFIGTRLTVLTKVNLVDIFYVSHPNENGAAYNKINQKHLDFLVCLPSTMKPIFGIELDDSSHNETKRQERDIFVNNVCHTAGLPLLRYPVQSEYNTRDVEKVISQFINENVKKPVVQQPKEITKNDPVPQCPKCGIPMILRTATQGSHKGEQFYGCKNYPKCKETKLMGNK